MTFKKKIIFAAVISFVMVVIAVTGFYIKSPELFNCFVINFSQNFSEAGENLYISNDTPVSLKDSIISVLNNADKRVCKFWDVNKRIGNPVIIFCFSKDKLKSYNKNNRIATHKTPFKSFVVFYKDCINLDILSHELSHAELCARIGYFKNVKIPVWFDEGLAMQVDYRKEYSEEKYRELKDSDSMNINLSSISEPAEFYSGNYYYHFILAKHEVSTWIKSLKQDELDNFLNQIKNGEDFYSVYEASRKSLLFK